jgi:hypothetical protein
MNARPGHKTTAVILVGGERERPTLAQVVEALRARNITAVHVDAHDDAAIGAATEELAPTGIAVLGRGEDFPRERIDVVRARLHALGLPPSRTITLAVADGARGLEQRVLAVAQRVTAAPHPRRPTPVLTRRDELRPAEADSTPLDHVVLAQAEHAIEPVDRTLVVRHESAPPTVPPISAPASATEPMVQLVARRRRWPMVLVAVGSLAVLVATATAIGTGREPANNDSAASASLEPPRPQPAETAQRDLDAVDDVGDTTVAVAETTSAPAETPPAAPVPTVPVPAVEDAPEVVAALREREVRALDLVVIAPEAKKPTDFAGASAYCDALVVAELDGWRLPEIGELLSMARAKIVRKGSYWSATKGDTFGDQRLVLVIKRLVISSIGTGWKSGRVVCVRERA